MIVISDLLCEIIGKPGEGRFHSDLEIGQIRFEEASGDRFLSGL